MSQDEIADWLRSHFSGFDRMMRLETVESGRATIRYLVGERHLRPGGTVMGPAIMLLADTAMYAALLGADRAATGAVTSNLNISFLHRPEPRDLIADAEVLRLGRSLSVGEVRMHSEGQGPIVAHATVTYSHR